MAHLHRSVTTRDSLSSHHLTWVDLAGNGFALRTDRSIDIDLSGWIQSSGGVQTPRWWYTEKRLFQSLACTHHHGCEQSFTYAIFPGSIDDRCDENLCAIFTDVGDRETTRSRTCECSVELVWLVAHPCIELKQNRKSSQQTIDLALEGCQRQEKVWRLRTQIGSLMKEKQSFSTKENLHSLSITEPRRVQVIRSHQNVTEFAYNRDRRREPYSQEQLLLL